MQFSRLGDDVAIVDNFTRRTGHLGRGTDSLTPIAPMQDRVAAWEQVSGHQIESHVLDLCDYSAHRALFESFTPDTILYYGEMP